MTCASLCLALGLTMTSSNGLGYESPYLGAEALLNVDHGAFVGRVDLSWQDAKKRDTGDGSGQSATVLAGVSVGRFDFLVGGWGSRTETSVYSKSAVSPMAAVDVRFKPGKISAFVRHSGDRKVGTSYGIRAESATRLAVVTQYEHIEFDSFFGVPGSGDKVTIAALWRFSKGNKP